jgi:HEPN domain-containing protein
MSPLAKEWLTKGLADLATAEREMRVCKRPNYDAVCFHSQQAVEKLLKAKLVMLGRDVPRSHDLAHLLGSVTDREPLWEAWRTAMNELAAYAVEFRYPGESADRDLAKRAVTIAKTACAEITARLGR